MVLGSARTTCGPRRSSCNGTSTLITLETTGLHRPEAECHEPGRAFRGSEAERSSLETAVLQGLDDEEEPGRLFSGPTCGLGSLQGPKSWMPGALDVLEQLGVIPQRDLKRRGRSRSCRTGSQGPKKHLKRLKYIYTI